MLSSVRGQGAIESAPDSQVANGRNRAAARLPSPTARLLLAQGATEYLVLLAVVLVIALVGIALLGFFPGTASDAQEQESKIYWQSASPIAITETAAAFGWPTISHAYVRMRNTGTYPVRITKVLGTVDYADAFHCEGGANCVNGLPSGVYPLRDYFYMAPGEEKYFNHWSVAPSGSAVEYAIYHGPASATAGPSNDPYLYTATSGCESTGGGTLALKDFGFEYVQYVEGQQITKTERGAKPLIIKCK